MVMNNSDQPALVWKEVQHWATTRYFATCYESEDGLCEKLVYVNRHRNGSPGNIENTEYYIKGQGKRYKSEAAMFKQLSQPVKE
jgi:hypothetical protein